MTWCERRESFLTADLTSCFILILLRKAHGLVHAMHFPSSYALVCHSWNTKPKHTASLLLLRCFYLQFSLSILYRSPTPGLPRITRLFPIRNMNNAPFDNVSWPKTWDWKANVFCDSSFQPINWNKTFLRSTHGVGGGGNSFIYLHTILWSGTCYFSRETVCNASLRRELNNSHWSVPVVCHGEGDTFMYYKYQPREPDQFSPLKF